MNCVLFGIYSLDWPLTWLVPCECVGLTTSPGELTGEYGNLAVGCLVGMDVGDNVAGDVVTGLCTNWIEKKSNYSNLDWIMKKVKTYFDCDTYRTIRTAWMIMLLIEWCMQRWWKMNRCQIWQRSCIFSDWYLHWIVVSRWINAGIHLSRKHLIFKIEII